MRIGATLIGLLIFVLLFVVGSSYGQKHNTHWYFGNQQALDFSSGKPIAVNNSQMLSIEANSSYSHPITGDLLLYTNGQKIWNAKHELMANGSDLWGHHSATQGTIICPKPGSPKTIYVFHIDRNGFAQNHNGGLNYSIVDLTLNNGLGDVMSNQKNIELMSESTEKVSIIPHENGCGLWIIGHKRNSNEFHAFLLTDVGFDEPVISSVGAIHETDTSTAAIGEMAVSQDGKKVALIVHQRNIIDLFHFDAASGKLSQPLSIEGDFHDYGVEFSPDGNLLYVSNFAEESHLRQYHISDWNKEQMDTTEVVIGRSDKDELRFGGLQLGPDGLLYMKRSTSQEFPDSLAAVLFPDKIGSDCGFRKNHLFLPLNHGAHAYGPELNFSNLISTNALPFGSECFDDRTFEQSKGSGENTKYELDRTGRNTTEGVPRE